MLGTALAYIEAAFFIARISFAAATAAGEACLSGGGDAGACWASAGTPATASPNARLAADNILATRFIQFSQDLRRYRRSTTRIPSEPARIAMLARPMNSPCSTTPGIKASNPARRGNDLFTQERAAAALDEIECRIDFVGAIDGEVEPIDIIEGGQWNAASDRVGAGCLRCRHAHDVEPGANPLAQKLDKMLRGRS